MTWQSENSPLMGLWLLLLPGGSFWALSPPWYVSGEPSSVFFWPFMCFYPYTVQYRYAKLEQPSQFGGQPCNFHGREEEDCTVPARYTCDNIPLCEGFLCAHTGIPHICPQIIYTHLRQPYMKHYWVSCHTTIHQLKNWSHKRLILCVWCEWVTPPS